MILALLVESALRSIALGGGAWLGLTLMRVRNLHLRMTVWTVVLFAAMAMPALTPWLRSKIPAVSPLVPLARITRTEIPWIAGQVQIPTDIPFVAVSEPHAVAVARTRTYDRRWLAIGVYVLVAFVMVLRLFIGWVLMWRVVYAARPVCDDWAVGVDIRVSEVVVVPVTFASTILLPSSCTEWSERKLQAVLLHEGSHVAQGDFYVLLIAAIHRAIFWFDPFSWWLLAHLAKLAEMVSDDAAIEGLEDRRCYADILLDVARNAQCLPSGLAMARPSTVHQRVERILAATAVSVRMSGRQRGLIAVALVPLAVFSAAPINADRVSLFTPPASGLPLDVPPARLDRYVGYFQINATSVLTVTREGEQFFAQSTGQPRLPLFATGDQKFVGEDGNANITFVTSSDGPASAVVLREPNAVVRRGVRIDVTRADEIEAVFQRRTAAAPDRFREQAPMQGGEAALRQMIEDLRRGAPNYSGMSPQLADKVRRQLAQFDGMLGALGAVESVSFRGVGPGGYDIYGVKFASGSGEFTIDLAPDGRMDDVNFRPEGDGTLGGVAACALESTLKSSHNTAPIRLSLTNRTGADIHLYWLDFDGHRVTHGRLAADESTFITTYITYPFVIADPSGQCREIILPGQATRFHVVEPPGASFVLRTTPISGSDKVLQQYIASIRRGDPDYDHMTPEAAAATRQRWVRQRAILANLGALRAMSFRGVTPVGSDIYQVQFANGSAEWQIGLDAEGRIGDIAIGPR